MPQTLQEKIIHSFFLQQKEKIRWMRYLNSMTAEEKKALEQILEFEKKEWMKILKKAKDKKGMLKKLDIFSKNLLKKFYREAEQREKQENSPENLIKKI